MAQLPNYTHRQNTDGSWYSVCMNCFDVVATTTPLMDENLLAVRELLHECKPGQAAMNLSGL